ncbi:MAG: DUF2225 domain-containing protein [Clostridia bacterium]|nr:DUF2225 domain-containing protein [Clostridia bacterium]
MSKTPITRYRAGHVILRQGESKDCLFKILSGTVALYVHYGEAEEYLMGSLTAPHFFGETTILSGQPSSYTAVAHSDVLAMSVPTDALEGYVKGDPRNALALLRELSDHFVTMNHYIADIEEAVKDSPMDGHVLKFLQDQYSTSEEVDLAGLRHEETLPPVVTAPQLAVEFDSLFLPGHKGYPDHTHPEYAKYLFDKEYTCPHCSKKFQGKHTFYADNGLVAVENPDALQYDLRIFYRDFEVEWYEVITCPHCLFSALDSFFTGMKYLHRHRYEEELLRVRESIWLDFSGERTLDFVFAQHYLALLCAPGFTDAKQITAHLWLNLCWLYRRYGDHEMADKAQAQAIEAYKNVYFQCGMDPAQEQHCCLLVAGMLYRTGDRTGAREWAARVRMNRMGKPAYAALAEALIGDVRMELAEEKAEAEAEALAAAAAARVAAEKARKEALAEAKNSRSSMFSSLLGRGKDPALGVAGDSGS